MMSINTENTGNSSDQFMKNLCITDIIPENVRLYRDV